MSRVTIEIPDKILISPKETPEALSRELSILAAVKLFELGKLSSGRAAQLANLSRVECLSLIGRYKVSPFTQSPEELEQDVLSAQKLSYCQHVAVSLPTPGQTARNLAKTVRQGNYTGCG